MYKEVEMKTQAPLVMVNGDDGYFCTINEGGKRSSVLPSPGSVVKKLRKRQMAKRKLI